VTAKETGLRGKVRDGQVVSDKMQKTIVVAIEANFRHRLYKKTVRRVRRFMAHDEGDEAKLGDRVRIVEASPISRRKRWRLLEVLTRADLPEVAPESIDLELLGEVKPEEPEVAEAAAEAPAAAAAEAISSPEADAVAPEEVAVAEEVPEIEEAAPEGVEQPEELAAEPEAETADVTPSAGGDTEPDETSAEAAVPDDVGSAEGDAPPEDAAATQDEAEEKPS
jgi:small subunit ribosomal protein S17